MSVHEDTPDLEDEEETYYEIDFVNDPRVQWFKERILAYIGIDDEDLFHNMLEEGDTKRKLANFIVAYLKPNDLSLEKRTFYITKIIVDKLIHEDKEFTEWRIIPPPPPPPPPVVEPKKGKKGKKAKAEPVADQEPDKGKGARGSKSAISLKDDAEIDTVAATVTDELEIEGPTESGEAHETDEKEKVPVEEYSFPPPPEDLDPEIDGTIEFYKVIRSIPRIIQYPKLIASFGALTPNTVQRNRRYIYFIRQIQEEIPLSETSRITKLKMPEYILVGSTSGRVLMSLGMQLKETFISLFKNQVRDINNVNTQVDQSKVTLKNSGLSLQRLSKDSTNEMNYLRPSDYRRMSNIARGENAERRIKNMRTEYIEKDTEWESRPSLSISKKFSEIDHPIHAKQPEVDKKRMTTDEVVTDIKELVGMVEWTIQHIEGEIQLPMPDIQDFEEDSGHVGFQDPQLTAQLEEAVMMWQSHIDKTISICLGKTREGFGPVAEYKYWRERDAEISLLVEQLKQPMVVKILSVLKRFHSTYLEGFNNYKERLMEQFNLAGDNLKFLSTLMRFFTVIEDDSPLQQVIDMLPEMVESLYMMWVLSKGYRTDETMVPLMSRISWALCDKLERFLNVHKLFDKSNDEILELTQAGQKIMELWHQLYRETRRDIELSGKGARWEFDQPLLFTRTDYIGSVASDLSEVVKVLIDFERIFGAELKSIISDPTQIDDVRKRVKNLVYPIRTIDFSVFVFDNKENWDVIMNDFWNEVKFLEDEAKNYIGQSFANLRSSEDALNVLLKFMEFDTRETIKKELSTKFDLVMTQFIKEITNVEDSFTRLRKNPPLLRNHPPAAGAIYWARALFTRLKQPILKFQKIPELNDCEQKKEAFLQYKSFAKVIKEYEDNKYKEWVEAASQFVDGMMKKNILHVLLKKEDAPAPTTDRGMKLTPAGQAHVAKKKASNFSLRPVDVVNKEIAEKRRRDKALMLMRIPGQHYENVRSPSSVSLLAKEGLTDVTWRDLTVHKLMQEYGVVFEPNFDKQIFLVIHEAELMEKLGFQIPSNIRDTSMQKSRLYYEHEALEQVITKYNASISTLSLSETHLMKRHLLDMERHILPGLTRITWTALGIKEYITDITKAYL